MRVIKKQKQQYFILDNRDILIHLIEEMGLLRKISAAGMYEIVICIYRSDLLTCVRPRFEQIGCAVIEIPAKLSPTGQIVHRDGICKRNYMSRKYSLIIPPHFEKRYRRAHISEGLFIFRTRREISPPLHYFCYFFFFTEYITYSYTRGYDRVKKPEGGGERGREVNGSFVMFQLVSVIFFFLRFGDRYVEIFSRTND